MVNVIVTGAAGRMGSTIIRLIHNDSELNLAGAVEHAGFKAIDAGIPANIGETGVLIVDDIYKLKSCNADVIVDFTAPEATLKSLEFAVENNIAIVIGTTGLQKEHKLKITDASLKIPIVQSPNMSVGVNTLFKITEIVANILRDDYDVEIVEAHHRFKKDAPSGTAVRLGEIVAKALNRKYPEDAVFERKGIIGERTDREIGMQTLRAGDIVGEHTVMFGGMGERIELTHRAHNRENFARGAVRAAKWIKGKDAGYYDMLDVLGLK
jgi:4-hydroxy-tetrahydrodipicolinate reductase